jgi:hypothetical protein
MEAWVTRTVAGIAPADEEARKAFDKHVVGSTFPIDVPVRNTRSLRWHRMYWSVMNMLGSNLEKVEVEPGLVLPIRNKDDAHLAMKFATGLFDSYVLEGGGVVRLVKSTAFDAMTADEWAAHWPKIMDAIEQVFLPGIDSAALRDEIRKAAN